MKAMSCWEVSCHFFAVATQLHKCWEGAPIQHTALWGSVNVHVAFSSALSLLIYLHATSTDFPSTGRKRLNRQYAPRINFDVRQGGN